MMKTSNGRRLQRLAAAACVCFSILLLSGCGNEPSTKAAVDDSHESSRRNEAGVLNIDFGPKPKPAAKTTPPADAVNPTAKVNAPPADAQPATSESDSHRKRIIGTWLQHNDEERTITVREDGTASIIAELSDYRQYIVGKKLEFDVEWTLEDGTLTFITTGGRPEESIKYITAIYGKSKQYVILEFGEDKLLLKKADADENEPDWTRIGNPPAEAENPKHE